MTNSTPQQIAEQRRKRESVRDGIIDKISAQTSILKLWTSYRGITAGTSQPEPESVIAIVNITHNRISCVRTIDHRRVRNGDTEWVNPMYLRCPVTGAAPAEATLFCIMAEPALKAIILTPPGWNQCWTLETAFDDEEDNDDMSVLAPIKTVTEAISPMPYKVIMTAPVNLVLPPEPKPLL